MDEHEHNNQDTHQRPARSGKGLRWRPWPCPNCDSSLTALRLLAGSAGANPALPESTPEKLAAEQVSQLLAWAQSCPHHSDQTLTLPKIAEGSEHEVFFRADDAMVFKTTRLGTYGESYYLHENRVYQRQCSPLEYLIRLTLWDEVFHSAPQSLGISTSGQIISAQPYITGGLPTKETVDEFLLASGFSDVKRHCFLWKKTYGTFDIWLGDARDENFVETPLGLVPIDVRMWFTEAEA